MLEAVKHSHVRCRRGEGFSSPYPCISCHVKFRSPDPSLFIHFCHCCVHTFSLTPRAVISISKLDVVLTPAPALSPWFSPIFLHFKSKAHCSQMNGISRGGSSVYTLKYAVVALKAVEKPLCNMERLLFL